MVRSGILFFIMLESFLLTGCGNQTIIDNHKKTVDFDEPIQKQIIIWHTYSEEETKVFENIVVPLFEQEYPNIDVKPVRQSYNEQLKSALISRASANKPPDIIRMDIAWLPTFAELNLLYPVSDFEDFADIQQNFYHVPLQSNLYKGVYYGLPLNTNTKLAIYNRSLLEDAGYTVPPKTISDLIDLVEKNDYTIGISGLSTWETLQYFYGLGGELTDPNFEQATGYLNSKESIQAVKKLLELHKNGHLPNKIVSGDVRTWQGVKNGNYIMIDEGQWFYSIQSLEEIATINNRTISAPFPVTNGKGSILGGENLVITRGTKNLEEAWTFLKWMTTETPQKLLFETGLIPTNQYVDLSKLFEKYPYYKPYVESLDDAFLRPSVAQWSRLDEIYTNYFKLIFSGIISVEDGLNEAAFEMDRILLQTDKK